MNRLQERYENEVVKSLMEKFNYSSKMVLVMQYLIQNY